ncbi:MAG: DUF1585 domain-containing protein [Sandaracinaceae bacterium]
MASRTPLLALAALAVSALAPAVALARPEGPAIFCSTYPDAPACRGRVPECTMCHTSTSPAAWNAYGIQVGAYLSDDFALDAANAIAYVDQLDADGDGIVNGDEIRLGTWPGDETSGWPYCAPAPIASDLSVPEGYDFARAVRRASILYCGRSPSYDEMAEVSAAGSDAHALHQLLHDRVEACLASDYWRDDALARLADPRVRPVEAVGARTPIGIVIGDFDWDYRLFAYALTEGRDARDLLLADYHVDRASDGTLVRVEGPFEAPRGNGAGGQPLRVDRRAGMITTQWFFAINTMFSPLPRTTAAQAYRAYLGADIARQQGIVPVAGEPLDVDDKGVTEDSCAQCHSTLDPLSYAFAEYEGIRGPATGVYDPSRPRRVIDGWRNPRTYLFGEQVQDVRAWAERAADSDEFLRNLAWMFFEHAMEREPGPADLDEVDAAWRAMRDDGYSANGLIHRLVDTSAFGGVR